MIGTDANPDRHLANRQAAGAMHGGCGTHGKARSCFGKDLPAFAQGQRCEGLVIESLHGATLIVIAHPAFEDHTGTGTGIIEPTRLGRAVNRIRAKAEAVHPPDTGGRKTISSPSCRR